MQGSTSTQLLDNLCQRRLINSDQRRIIEADALQTELSVATLLSQYGFIDESVLMEFTNDEHDVRVVSLDNLLIDADALQWVDAATARRLKVLPIFFDNSSLRLEVAISDPSDVLVHDALEDLLRLHVSLSYCQAPLSEIEAAIARAYGFEQSLEFVIDELSKNDISDYETLDDVSDKEQGHPIVRLTNGLIMQAYRSGASDVHFEPEANYFRVRFRIDGMLKTWRTLHIDHWLACTTRLKVIGGLNIAESRNAQDGAFSLSIGSSVVDLRISVFPTLHGENVVLRLLDPANANKRLDQTGFDNYTRAQLLRVVSQPQGLVLLVGPTGCGKTTTLYALLNYLSDDSLNIMTLEDPVEYRLPGIRQTSVQSGKLDFASGVRGVLRQDPDIILIGEIRDRETAELALRASMTGHLVFSTLHTRSAFGVFQRLMDLGVERGVLLESVMGVISQRLLRTHCQVCRGTTVTSSCSACHGSGYSGRTAVAEVLHVDAALREFLHLEGWVLTESLQRVLEDSGFRTLEDAAWHMVDSGVTSVAEVHRVFGQDCCRVSEESQSSLSDLADSTDLTTPKDACQRSTTALAVMQAGVAR